MSTRVQFAVLALAGACFGACTGSSPGPSSDASGVRVGVSDAGAARPQATDQAAPAPASLEQEKPPGGAKSRFDRPLPEVDAAPLAEARAFTGFGKYADLLKMVDRSPLPDVTGCERVTGAVVSRSDEETGSSYWSCAAFDPPVFMTDDLMLIIAGDLKDRMPAYLFVDGVKPEVLPTRGLFSPRKREPEPTRPASFTASVKALLRRPVGEDLESLSERYRTPVYVHWMARGYWAARLGQAGLARKCLARAVKLAAARAKEWKSEEMDARGLLRSEFAVALDLLTRELVTAYADDRISLACARYVRELDDSKDAAELVRSLERRAALRRRYADFIEKMPDGVKGSDRVDLLLFHLMDYGKRLNVWAGKKVPRPLPGLKSPAAELDAMGREAVPALIARMDDPALTRAILRDGWKGTRYIDSMTLGKQVLQVLNSISGLSFGYSTDAETRAKVEQWWAKAKGASEVGMAAEALMHAVEHDRGSLAAKLLDEKGEKAWKYIGAAFEKTESSYAREYFVAYLDQAAEPGDSRALEFLARAAKDEHSDVRFRAMAGQIRRGKREVVASVVAELRKKPAVELTEYALKALLPLGNDAIFEELTARLDNKTAETYRVYAGALGVLCREDMTGDTPDEYGEKCGMSDAHRARLVEHFEAIVAQPQGFEGLYATVLDYTIKAYNDITQQDTHWQDDFEGLARLLEVVNASRKGRGLEPFERPDLELPEMPRKPVPWDRVIGRVHVVSRPGSAPKEIGEWLGSFSPGRKIDLGKEAGRLQKLASNNRGFELGLSAIRFRDGRPCLLWLEARVREGAPPEHLSMVFKGPDNSNRLYFEKEPDAKDESYDRFLESWKRFTDVRDYEKVRQYTLTVSED